MKRVLVIGLLLNFTFVAAGALAPKATAPSQICFYDPEMLASQSDEWRALVMEVDKKYQKEADVIKAAEAKFQEEVKAFNAKVAVLSESARESEAEGLERKKTNLENSAKQMVADYQKAREKVNVRFYKTLEDSVTNYIEKESHFYAAVPKTPGVFVKKGVNDETMKIASHMNREYNGRKSAAAPLIVAKK
jgi:Skp family chaperone for outer membrane proteins